MSTCNHKWSEETHEGVLSRCCHVCNEWEVELELDALEAELTSTKAAVIDAALIHAKLIQERDELQAKLDAELPAMWREDIASLNECLERVGRERDTLREEVARLNTLLLSATGENQKRAEREARALEDWRELRAENDRLKAIRNFDVEYARLDTMWQQLVRERDAAVAKATAHERDWYEAKSEFGTAAAKLRDQVRASQAEAAEARRDFVRVADALGLVGTDDTGRIGAIASVEDIVTQARHAAKALAREQPVAEEE